MYVQQKKANICMMSSRQLLSFFTTSLPKITTRLSAVGLSPGGVSLLGRLRFDLLLALQQLGLGLAAHLASAPPALYGLVELRPERLLQSLEARFRLLGHTGHRQHGGGLLVGQGAESGLALRDQSFIHTYMHKRLARRSGSTWRIGGWLVHLDDAEGHVHLPAQRRKPQHQFDGVDVVGDHHQAGLLLLHQGRHVLQAVLQKQTRQEVNNTVREEGGGWVGSCLEGRGRRSSCGGGLTASGSKSGGLQTLRLGGLGLGLDLHEQLEKLGSLVLVQSVRELVNGRRNLQPLKENLNG